MTVHRRSPRHIAASLVAVLGGGMLGTALRLGIDLAIPHADGEFPLSTLLVNILGAFVLGVLVARVWPIAPDWLRAGLGAGVLGSFTTFSAIAVSVVALGTAGSLPLGIASLLAEFGLGLAAAFAGLRLGGTLSPEIDLEAE